MAGRYYLGDSVYVEEHDYMLTLLTDNGDGPSNIIHLEPATLRALLRYVSIAKEDTPTTRTEIMDRVTVAATSTERTDTEKE